MFDFLNPYMVWIKLAGCALLVAAGAYGGYRWELGAYNGLVAADAKAMTVAVQLAADKQHRIDLGNQGDAVDQAYFRGRLDGTVISLKMGVPANVTFAQDESAAAASAAGCITVGFARMLYAGAHGVTADSLPIAGGESVDTCTALKPSDLAAAVAQDLAAGYGNGHQLDSLIGAVKRNDAILTSPTTPK